MKHITLIFCKVLSGLYQQGVLTSNREDMLLKAWQEAVKVEDKKKLMKLIKELFVVNLNLNWQMELNNVLEELAQE